MATQQKIELERRRPIAIIRLDDLSEAVNISQALVAGGITALEFTLTNREALKAVQAAREALGNTAQVGAGTVTTADDARAAIEAGSEFLVTPVMLPDVIAVAREANVVIMCGAFSPTEDLDGMAAWRRFRKSVSGAFARPVVPQGCACAAA